MMQQKPLCQKELCSHNYPLPLIIMPTDMKKAYKRSLFSLCTPLDMILGKIFTTNNAPKKVKPSMSEATFSGIV
jgi:hypothetical protein